MHTASAVRQLHGQQSTVINRDIALLIQGQMILICANWKDFFVNMHEIVRNYNDP